MSTAVGLLVWVASCAGRERAAPPISPRAVGVAGPPLAPWFERAGSYLDRRSASWIDEQPQVGNNVACALSCHTTVPFLLVRPSLVARDSADATMRRVRAKVEARVLENEAWASATPMYGEPESRKASESLATEAVLNAATLAMNDARTGDRLAPATAKAFAHMWQMQRPDGSWDWLEFGLQPWESGDSDWAAGLASVAVGFAPERFASRAANEKPIERMVAYLRKRVPAMSLQNKALVLWSSAKLPTLLSDAERTALATELVAARRADGSFSVNTLLGGEAGIEGDGYATGLVLVALCATKASQVDAIRGGLAWLEKSQSADGAWHTRSLNRDAPRNHLYMSDAATAYAAMALTTCHGGTSGHTARR